MCSRVSLGINDLAVAELEAMQNIGVVRLKTKGDLAPAKLADIIGIREVRLLILRDNFQMNETTNLAPLLNGKALDPGLLTPRSAASTAAGENSRRFSNDEQPGAHGPGWNQRGVTTVIGEHDLIDIQMPPSGFAVIDNFEPSLATGKLRHIPRC